MLVNITYVLIFACLLPYLLVMCIVDKVKERRTPGALRLFGVEGYFGLPGRGKTMCMSYRANELRKMYGDKILIASNYGFRDEDFAFTDWHQLLETYDRPLVLLWDEIQNDLASRSFKATPPGLLYKLTQVRKGHGVLLLYTAQRYDRVEKIIRELTFKFHECHTYLGRFTISKVWDDVSYAAYKSTASLSSKDRIRGNFGMCFIQNKKTRSLYDSFATTETNASNEYMTREEMKQVSDI